MNERLSPSVGTARARDDDYLLRGGDEASNYRNTALVVGAILVASISAAFYLLQKGAGVTPVVVGTVLSVLLAALPILICHVQGTSRERMLARLDSISDHAVSKTAYFAEPRTAIRSIEPVALDRYYLLPIATLAVVLAFGFFAIFLVTHVEKVFEVHSFLFGGATGLSMKTDELALYQKGTFLMLAMAFIGSYVCMLNRLLYRILNNDIYPISFYSTLAPSG